MMKYRKQKTAAIRELGEMIKNYDQTLIFRDVVGSGAGVSHDGTRDIYEIYGYPSKIQFGRLYRYARRSGIANRIVFGMPKSCWSDGFKIYTDTSMEEELYSDTLPTFLSEHIGAFERADALNRIGRFSVLYVGIPDGKDPREPVGRVKGNGLSSVYFRPFAYDGIQILRYDNNQASERYGLPELYQLSIRGRGDNEKTQDRRTIVVHHSRCIHIVETKFDSEVEGVPALEPVFNRILDIDKATGGAAEAYFRNARFKIAYEIDKEFASSLMHNEGAKREFDEAAKRFTNDWQDQIKVMGAKVVPVSSPHYTPIDTIKAALWDIAAQTRYPIRLLTGEGAGQLAGSEDKLAYNVLVDDRQTTFCSVIVRRALSILSESGIIEGLPDFYHIEWNKQDSTTELEQVDIDLKRSQVLAAIGGIVNGMQGEAFNLESMLAALNLKDIKVEDIDFGSADGELIDEMLDPATPDKVKADFVALQPDPSFAFEPVVNPEDEAKF